MALPGLALTTLLVCYLEPGILSIVVAISVTSWTGTTRVLRSRILSLKEEPFIKIEKAIGQKDIVIMFKHLLPNIKDMILSRGAMAVSGAMMTEASLSFLGLGAFAEKSWGAILHFAFFLKWCCPWAILVVSAAHHLHLSGCAWFYAGWLLRSAGKVRCKAC